jgi:rubrerythrin
MPKFRSINDILDFAIGQEHEAHEFYVELARRVSKPDFRELIKGFAIEEQRHAIRLEAIKAGDAEFVNEEVRSFDVSVAAEDRKPHAEMNYADLLRIAISKEKAAHRLYSNLASVMGKQEFRDALLGLAKEEAQHQLTLEIEYDWVAF